MVKRTSLINAECPVARGLDTIGDWWSLLIIRDAFNGISRFNEFQNNLGIAKGMLSTRLRDLVARGVLKLIPASDGTAYKEYILTKTGEDLFTLIVALRQWGEDHLYKPEEDRSVLVEIATSAPVGRLVVRSEDGRPLRPTETRVQGRDHGVKKRSTGTGASAGRLSPDPPELDGAA